MSRFAERHEPIIGVEFPLVGARGAAWLDPQSASGSRQTRGDCERGTGGEEFAPVTPAKIETDDRTESERDHGVVARSLAQVIGQGLLERGDPKHGG